MPRLPLAPTDGIVKSHTSTPNGTLQICSPAAVTATLALCTPAAASRETFRISISGCAQPVGTVRPSGGMGSSGSG